MCIRDRHTGKGKKNEKLPVAKAKKTAASDNTVTEAENKERRSGEDVYKRQIEAIYKAHEVNQEIIRFFDQIIAECGKEKHSYESCAVPQELFDRCV